MPPLNPPLNKNDFINSGWHEVVNSSERKQCLAYHDGFWKKAEEAKEAGNLREQAVFEILAAITGAEIKPESNEEFFAQVFHNLTEEHLHFLREIISDISDPELEARVADILWSRERNYQMAQRAVTAYLNKVEQSEPWVKFAGMFKDDPLFDEFVEDMAAYRRELDAQIPDSEVTSGENQSA